MRKHVNSKRRTCISVRTKFRLSWRYQGDAFPRKERTKKKSISNATGGQSSDSVLFGGKFARVGLGSPFLHLQAIPAPKVQTHVCIFIVGEDPFSSVARREPS